MYACIYIYIISHFTSADSTRLGYREVFECVYGICMYVCMYVYSQFLLFECLYGICMCVFIYIYIYVISHFAHRRIQRDWATERFETYRYSLYTYI